LGILNAYYRNREGGYDKGKEIYENYSSLDYLTKILSIKSVIDGYDLKSKVNKNYFK
jgi:hypothetical protein